MNIVIRLAKEGLYVKYLDLMQRTYQEAFTDETLALPAERFSKEVLHHPASQRFFKRNEFSLYIANKQRSTLQ